MGAELRENCILVANFDRFVFVFRDIANFAFVDERREHSAWCNLGGYKLNERISKLFNHKFV